MDITEAVLELTKLMVEKDYIIVPSSNSGKTYVDAVCETYQQFYRSVADPYNEG